MPKEKPLSHPMRKVLANLLVNLKAGAHCRCQSDYGGLVSTMRALKRRGLITSKEELTEEGRRVALWLKN